MDPVRAGCDGAFTADSEKSDSRYFCYLTHLEQKIDAASMPAVVGIIVTSHTRLSVIYTSSAY